MEKLTPEQIILKADQVIEDEKQLSDPDFVFAYSYGFALIKSYLQDYAKRKKQRKTMTKDQNTQLMSLIAAYGKAMYRAGSEGVITDELLLAIFPVVQYAFELTDMEEDATLPSQENENPTKS